MSSAAAMEAIDELVELSQSMRQAASLLADDDPSDETASRRPSTFLNAVVLGNVGAGKSAVLNSLIGHPVLPTGENGATRAPIVVDLQRDPGLSSKSIVLQIDSKSQQVSASSLRHSLQDRLSKGASSGSGKSQSNEIYIKLRTSTAPPLKLIDLPGIDQRVMDDSTECNLEEIEEELSKSSKDSKKANSPEKGPSLVFKITNKVGYKTVLKAHSAVILKAESMVDKIEWVKKIRGVILSKGGSVKGPNISEGGTMRQNHSDGSLDTMARRPADPEEELRWMSQEVRGYVEAVLNSLAANVPKTIVLCQVEKSKEDMLNQLYSSISAQSNAKIEELLQEDHNAKRRREKYQKQSSLLSKLTRQLSIHDNKAASYSNDSSGAEVAHGLLVNLVRTGSLPLLLQQMDPFDRSSSQHETRSRSADSRGRRYENGDANLGSRRTPNRLPRTPPQSGGRY